MSVEVDPTAVVSAGARLAEGVTIGPYAVVGDEVELGMGTTVGAHAQLEGPAILGEKNRVFPHAVIGFEPQDLKYKGEKTRLLVGAGNIFREFSTVHRGTAAGRGETVIGDGNLFMAYSHVAHDCLIGSKAVMANYAALAGHVDVEDGAILGAFVGAHQFIRVGKYAFVGAYTALRQDVLPFCRTDGGEARTYGLNTVGLRRAGFSRERIEALGKAYRLLVKSKLNTSQALERIAAELSGQPDVEHLINFVRGSARGFHR